MRIWYVLCAALSVLPVSAVEIATGKMLGNGFDTRSFYVRASAGRQWTRTYSARQYRPEAAGRLMNIRLAQAVFEDDWLTETAFDPERNTSNVIAALDAYKSHGVLAITVSLQGGNMAYAREAKIPRERAYKLGKGKGSYVSAFRPDGSLKAGWMSRLLRLQRELDKRGMVLDLIYFYGSQDEVLEDTSAIDRATANATDWLIDHACRNVIIEIANEHDIRDFDHGRYIHEHIGDLIRLARSRFDRRKARFRLPISASTGDSMTVFAGVRDHSDLTMIHGNGRSAEDKRRRVAELRADPAIPGPIYMNEDDNGRETTRAHFENELASAAGVFEAGGSWGYMPWVQAQVFPFRHFHPGARGEVRDDMPVDQRDPAYFKAVLERIRALVMEDRKQP